MKRRLILACVIALLCVGGAAGAWAQSFKVGKGDLLAITVYEHKDLSMNARVSADGTIKVPFLGSVTVAGMTSDEVAESLMRLYVDEQYLVNPQIMVFVEEYKSRKANILGQVKSPGQYEVDEETSIMILVTMASGFTPRAYKKSAQVIRRVDGEKTIIDDVSMDEKVIPGDIIVIQESFF